MGAILKTVVLKSHVNYVWISVFFRSCCFLTAYSNMCHVMPTTREEGNVPLRAPRKHLHAIIIPLFLILLLRT